jgi:3-hydroxyisobutyrate dehydrogenase-like beta-hydroxyacid dehydrogenase
MRHRKVGIVGFGEAARAFASGWTRHEGQAVAAYDLKISAPGSAAEIISACRELGVEAAHEPRDAVAAAGMLFSLVTADQALVAAEGAAGFLAPGALYFDCNSCSPLAKVTAARLVEAAGGRYVDVAVMSPVHPARHLTPLLVAGPHAEAAIEALEGLGMNPKSGGDKVGQASSTKMLRSVIIKGLEALTAEAMLAARRAGVEEAVIASLQASDPGINWVKRSSYNLERMMVHGGRRAAEMREVAATLRDLGLPDRMSSASAEWQSDIAHLGLPPGLDDLASRADAILARMNEEEGP